MIPDQAARLDEPAEGSFDDPTFRQHHESFHIVAALDDLKIDLAVSLEPGDFLDQLSRVASVSPDELEPTVGSGEDRHQQAGSVTILNVGGCHLQRENEAEGVY
jgi:hypothetical protein